MRIEIVEITTIYPDVFVIEEGSLNLLDLSAKIICRCHIDKAEAMKRAVNQ